MNTIKKFFENIKEFLGMHNGNLIKVGMTHDEMLEYLTQEQVNWLCEYGLDYDNKNEKFYSHCASGKDAFSEAMEQFEIELLRF